MKRLPIALAACAAAVSAQSPPRPPTISAVAESDGVKRGLDNFRAHNWQGAIDALRPEWRRGNRQFRIAYYVGASHCNTGRYPDGKAWLDYALTRMRPPPSPAQVIAEGLANCAPSSPPPTRWITTSEWSRTAELLYYGSNARLRYHALDGADAVPGAVLAQRLVPAADAAAMARTAAALIAALDRPPNSGAGCARGGPVTAQVAGRFLFVTRVGTAPFVLKAWGNALEAYVHSLGTRLGVPPPASAITVYLARCADDAAAIAHEVHGLSFDPQAVAGYSVQEDMSLVALWGGYLPGGQSSSDSDAMRTIRHEIAHLMLRDWFGDIPGWLDEGLAQYLGVTADGPAAGHTTILHSSWGAPPGMAQVIAPPLESGCVKVANVMMAADSTRMMLAWLDEKPGGLKTLLATMRAYSPDEAEKRSDAQLLAQALGMSISEIDAAWRKASVIRIDDTQFHETSGDSCPT